MPTALPLVKSGKVKALAISTKERSPVLPDVPTMSESGYPGFEVSSWFGLMAPAGTPPEVIAKLNAAVINVMSKPEIEQKLKSMGATTEGLTPSEFGAFIKKEVDVWRGVVKASGTSIDD